jgi:hypothetical protein
MKINFYTDPGHGWGAVKRSVLRELGIIKQITPYSYQRGDTVYLEEDCDLPTFCDKILGMGMTYTIEHKHTDRRHPIRSYDRFSSQGE